MSEDNIETTINELCEKWGVDAVRDRLAHILSDDTEFFGRLLENKLLRFQGYTERNRLLPGKRYLKIDALLRLLDVNKIIQVGPALCCMTFADGKKLPEDLNFYFNNFDEKFPEFQEQLGHPYITAEFQPMKNWTKDDREIYVLNQEHYDFVRQQNIGVHMPITGNPHDIFAAMHFAHEINADYFVIHLTPDLKRYPNDYELMQKNPWYFREKFIEHWMKEFQNIARFYNENNFNFVPCIENLEFPKFPCTPKEVEVAFYECKKYLPNLQILCDIAHFWRSQSLIQEFFWKHAQGDSSKLPHYPVYMANELEKIQEPFHDFFDHAIYDHNALKFNIHVFHLAGCDGYHTHLIPGLRNDENPDEKKVINIRRGYDESREMNFERMLKCFSCYVLDTGVRTDEHNNLIFGDGTMRKSKIILECYTNPFQPHVNGVAFEHILNGAKSVRDYILQYMGKQQMKSLLRCHVENAIRKPNT